MKKNSKWLYQILDDGYTHIKRDEYKLVEQKKKKKKRKEKSTKSVANLNKNRYFWVYIILYESLKTY